MNTSRLAVPLLFKVTYFFPIMQDLPSPLLLPVGDSQTYRKGPPLYLGELEFSSDPQSCSLCVCGTEG